MGVHPADRGQALPQRRRLNEVAQIAEVMARIAATYADISTADIERVVQTVHTGFDDAQGPSVHTPAHRTQGPHCAGPPPDPTQLDNLASERYLFVREPAGERGDHLHELPALDSAVPEFTLH